MAGACSSPSNPLSLANGGTGVSAASDAALLADLGALALVATTGPTTTPYTLAATGAPIVILTWTAPNDSKMHRFTVNATQRVTANETGGVIQVAFNAPDGTASTFNLFPGGGSQALTAASGSRQVEPNTTVTVSQTSNLTGGAAILWADLFAS